LNRVRIRPSLLSLLPRCCALRSDVPDGVARRTIATRELLEVSRGLSEGEQVISRFDSVDGSLIQSIGQNLPEGRIVAESRPCVAVLTYGLRSTDAGSSVIAFNDYCHALGLVGSPGWSRPGRARRLETSMHRMRTLTT
jgi:hypothetical protein